MTRITCARPGCGVVKDVRNSAQRYCSHQCDMAMRDPAQKREAGLRGGHRSGQVRWASSLDEWRKAYPEIPPEVAREIYERGYGAGNRARHVSERRRSAA
jgi:hypothetical protein